METTLIQGVTAADVLRNEHQRVKELFRQFDDATSDRQKKSVGDACLRQIEIYTALEEEIFYPAVRRHVGERQRVVQGQAALQVAKILIKELKGLSGGEHYNARFNILKENVVQHIEENEAELLPRVEKSDMDLQQMAQQMLLLKKRVAPSINRSIDGRSVAAVAAAATAIGVTAWLVNRFRNDESIV